MSGGLAYVLDEQGEFARVRCNQAGVDLEPLFEREDILLLEGLIRKHVDYTGSALGKRLLEHWPENLKNFVKVFPHEYKRILKARSVAAEKKDMVVTVVPPQPVAVGDRAR
jgi:glutamate synthase domain-containing protein 3